MKTPSTVCIIQMPLLRIGDLIRNWRPRYNRVDHVAKLYHLEHTVCNIEGTHIQKRRLIRVLDRLRANISLELDDFVPSAHIDGGVIV